MRAWPAQPGPGAPELIRGTRRPVSARRPTTKRWSPPSARNVSTCVGCTSHARACSALDAARHRPDVHVDQEAKDCVRDGALPTRYPAEDWNDARPEHATAEPQPPCGEHPRALAPATTSASAGSGHPTAPQTRKPRYSAVSEALCRTRTGDPFLTMAVSPGAEASARGRNTCNRRQQPGSRSRQRPATIGTCVTH